MPHPESSSLVRAPAAFLCGLVVAAFVLAACSSTGASPSTPSVVTDTELAAGELVGEPEARELLDVLYGQIVMQGGCDLAAADLVGVDLPTNDAVTGAVDEVFTALESVGPSCEDPADWNQQMAAVIGQIDDLDRLVRAPEEAPHTYDDLPNGDRAVQMAPAAVRAVERLDHTLSGRHPVGASDLWFSSQHLGFTAQLRDVVEGSGAPEALIVGSSVAFRGIDAETVADALGQDVTNVGLVGASLPVVGEWLAEIRSLGVAPARVIWALNTHELYVRTGSGPITEPAGLRTRAFDPLAPSVDAGRLDWVLGPVGSPVSSSSPIGADWLDRFASRDPVLRETDEKVLARHRSQLDRYVDPEPRLDEMAAVAAAVEAAAASGAEVTLVSMPIHSEVVAAHPDGAEGHERALARLGELAPEAEIIDLSGVAGDALMVDLLHVDGRGRTAVSARLAEELSS